MLKLRCKIFSINSGTCTLLNINVTIWCIVSSVVSQIFVEWCLRNLLRINTGKTKELVVDFHRQRHTPPTLMNIQATNIEMVILSEQSWSMRVGSPGTPLESSFSNRLFHTLWVKEPVAERVILQVLPLCSFETVQSELLLDFRSSHAWERHTVNSSASVRIKNNFSTWKLLLENSGRQIMSQAPKSQRRCVTEQLQPKKKQMDLTDEDIEVTC